MEQTVKFGNSAGNRLTLDDNGVLFGFDGNDTLSVEASSSALYQAFMVGGQGNDTYLFDGDIATIVDTGGYDSLTLPGSRSEYLGAFLEGRDLMLMNQWTGQQVLILDAKGRGTIETFHTEYGETLSFSQVASAVYSEGMGNISYRQLEQETGGIFKAEEFAAAREVNLAWARMDWDAVWQQADNRGGSDEAIATTLDSHLTKMLSPAAQQYWRKMDGPESLRLADFEGAEQHLPSNSDDHHDDGNHDDWPALIPRETVERIALLYEAALDRVPDIGGLNYWVEESYTLDVEDVAERFLDSDEFQQRFDVSSNGEFIDQLYLNVLDRNADAGGEAFWQGQMAAGMSQGEVLSRFADSDENVANATWLAGLERTDDGWVIA